MDLVVTILVGWFSSSRMRPAVTHVPVDGLDGPDCGDEEEEEDEGERPHVQTHLDLLYST